MKCLKLSFLLATNGFLLLTGLILLIAFPNWIVQRITANLMYLHQDSSGKSSFITDYWERLPAVHYFKFYAFNITNSMEVMFYGHEPIIEEKGPYVYAMVERKQNIKYLENGNLVSFIANKTFAFDHQRSCPTCLCSDKVAIPNFVYMGLLYYKRTEKMPNWWRFILDMFIVVMRMQPIKLSNELYIFDEKGVFREQKVCDVLLDSYYDPVLVFIESPIYKFFKQLLHINTPTFGRLGIFPEYNKTSDGDFVIMTGKDDIANIGQIVSWDNYTELPWWRTPESRKFAGCGDGINQRPGIGKSDRYEMFQPYLCRKLPFQYSGYEGQINGIPTLAYTLDGDSMDGIKDFGYRYENLEKANYYPDWPCGPNHTVEITERCGKVNCDLFENWCDKCCNGSYLNGTYVLPPGIYQEACQPARAHQIPLGVLLSAPHFLWSPPEVRNSLKGLKPDPIAHHPGMFHVNSFTGHTVGANVKIQINVPLYPNTGSIVWGKVPTRIIPIVWLEIDVQILDYALNFFYFIAVFLEKLVFFLSIALLVLSALLTTYLMCTVMSNKSQTAIINIKQEPASYPRLNNAQRL